MSQIVGTSGEVLNGNLLGRVVLDLPLAWIDGHFPLRTTVEFCWALKHFEHISFFLFVFGWAVPYGMWELSFLTRITPCPLHWQCGVLTSGLLGKSLNASLASSGLGLSRSTWSQAACVSRHPSDTEWLSRVKPDR